LKLEVKTLETKLAPGSCYQWHMDTASAQGISVEEAQAQWDNYLAASDPDFLGGQRGAGAGVPVIGIN